MRVNKTIVIITYLLIAMSIGLAWLTARLSDYEQSVEHQISLYTFISLYIITSILLLSFFRSKDPIDTLLEETGKITEGKIIGSEEESSLMDDSPLKIFYEYEVNGKKYKSTHYFTTRTQKRVPVGKIFQVYYLPNSPEDHFAKLPGALQNDTYIFFKYGYIIVGILVVIWLLISN